MSRRVFTLVEGTASKFWAITLDGDGHTVEFGRIGTSGQSSRKDFGSHAEARTSHDKLVAEKVRKGYVEEAAIPSSAPAAAATAAAPGPPKPKVAPSALRKAAPKAKEAVETPEAEPKEGVKSEPAKAHPAMAEAGFDLEPYDWAWASWRPFEPVPLGEPEPFDLERSIAEFRKATASPHAYQWRWDEAKIPTNPGPEAARFWLNVFIQQGHGEPPAGYFNRMQKDAKALTKTLPKILPKGVTLLPMSTRPSAEIGAIIFRSYPTAEYLQIFHAPDSHTAYMLAKAQMAIFEGFRRFVRPHLDARQIAELRGKAVEAFDPEKIHISHDNLFPMCCFVAASLGATEAVADLVARIPDDHYTRSDIYAATFHHPQWLALGLGDPAKIEAEWRRLKLRHNSPDQVRAWLATTGGNALDLVRDSILSCSKKEDAQGLMEAFARARIPEAAPYMIELMGESKAPKPAREWLDANPAVAIAGLIAAASGKGKLADAALDYLREQKKKGMAGVIAECLESAGPGDRIRREVLDREEVEVQDLDDASTPGAIRAGVAESAKIKPPTWVGPGDLPRILIKGRSLTEDQTSALLAGLGKSTLAEPAPIVKAAREHADRASLDAFAWSLFERWLHEGAASKEKWAMMAIGLLGSDACAVRLTPLIRAWPGESQHGRAVLGLECLRAIGTDGAMMRLNGIAQKVPFKGLKNKAAEMMEAIAQDRNMSRSQLEDRIVPDCDLDDRGSRVFDFGPRRFAFVLGPEMKPMVRDPEGKLKPELPKPAAKDDPTLSAEATEAWKLLKKQVREVAKVQALRLEQAMVTGRRWPVEDFETLLVQHPLMTNLVRLILWGGYDEAGKLVSTFRVTDERDYADSKEEAIRLDGLDRVGIVHPIHLTSAEASAWGEIFGDYEIIPPFPQLGRAIHRLEPGEAEATDLKDRVPGAVAPRSLVGILEGQGWTRGIVMDAGIFDQHLKAFEGADVTAVIGYPGLPMGGYMDTWGDQIIHHCGFMAGLHTPEKYANHGKPIPLGRVDPVALSEVLADLALLAEKAK